MPVKFDCISFRERYKRRPTKILLHICFNLLAGYITFVTGIDDVNYELRCTAVAVLLQYFFLATCCWMFVYSYGVYCSLVKVSYREYENYCVNFCKFFNFFCCCGT